MIEEAVFILVVRTKTIGTLGRPIPVARDGRILVAGISLGVQGATSAGGPSGPDGQLA